MLYVWTLLFILISYHQQRPHTLKFTASQIIRDR